MDRYDAAIIGFGKGGKTLAAALAKSGQRVALVEQSPERYGGTCINVACIPTKTLVHAAALSQARGGSFDERAERYAAAIDEKNRVTGMLREKNRRKLADDPQVDLIDGRAAFVSATLLAVHPTASSADDDCANGSNEPLLIEANRVFVNTGARAFVPPIPGVDGPRVHTSDTLLNVRELPKRLVIIGGGYIGLEFASMFANFGSTVSVVQNEETFLPREDGDIAAAVLASLEDRGVRVVRAAAIERIDEGAGEATVVIATKGEREQLAADAVLVATGRRPNVEGLDVEAAGIELTDRGAVRTDERLRTNVEGVSAMGDVAGGLQFTYISLDDSRIVLDDILGSGERTTENRGAVPYSVFLDPPFSRVGMTEQEARSAGYAVQTALLPAAAIPKAQVLGKPVGLLKAVIDAETNLVLGVHLFCEESHEMINLAKLAIDADLPYQRLRDAIYTHPTMSEAFNDLLAAVGVAASRQAARPGHLRGPRCILSSFELLLRNEHRYLRGVQHFMADASHVLFEAAQPPVANDKKVVGTLIDQFHDLRCRVRSREQQRIHPSMQVLPHLLLRLGNHILAILDHHVENFLEVRHLRLIKQRNGDDVDDVDMRMRIDASQVGRDRKRSIAALGFVVGDEQFVHGHVRSPFGQTARAAMRAPPV